MNATDEARVKNIEIVYLEEGPAVAGQYIPELIELLRKDNGKQSTAVTTAMGRRPKAVATATSSTGRLLRKDHQFWRY